MSSVRRNRFLNLLSLVIEDRSTAIKALILLVVQGIAAATAPRLLGVAVDKAETDGFTPIFLVGVSYLMVELVRISSSRLQAVEFSRIGQGAVHRLRVRLFDHVMKLSWSDLKRIGPTDLLSRLTVDIRSISSLFEACFLRIIERLVSVIAILIGIISISPTLGGGAVGLLPIVFIGSWFSSKRLYAAFYERQAAFSAVMTSISDSVELADEIKILELSKKRLAHFLTQSSRLAEVQKIPQYFFGRLHASMSILSAISVGTILILGQSYIADGSLSKGQLVTLVAYTGSIFWPIIVIIDQWSVLLQGLASADRLFEIFETSSKNLPFSDLSSLKNNGSKSAVFSELQGPPPMVLFKDISFRYPETGRGVASLNFSIKQGERVGIVGATGSGKSTIYRLLLRLVQPDSGEIFVDGEDLELIDENKLRQMVGFMPQHPEIFSGKAHENITLEFFAENTSGDRILGDELSVQTDIKSRSTFDLGGMPQNLVSILESSQDASESFSVGERQCIAALRVFLRSPKIIALDEPTSSIDPKLEEWLTNIIFDGSESITYLIIAHRLETVRRCDRILVLDEGRLVEIGSHDELMARGGKYCELVEAAKGDKDLT